MEATRITWRALQCSVNGSLPPPTTETMIVPEKHSASTSILPMVSQKKDRTSDF